MKVLKKWVRDDGLAHEIVPQPGRSGIRKRGLNNFYQKVGVTPSIEHYTLLIYNLFKRGNGHASVVYRLS